MTSPDGPGFKIITPEEAGQSFHIDGSFRVVSQPDPTQAPNAQALPEHHTDATGGASFLARERKTVPLKDPNGQVVDKPWWDNLDVTRPRELTHLPADVLRLMQRQAPNSCQLTAQINALIARGLLNPTQADVVRNDLLLSEKYSIGRNGTPGMGDHWRSGNPRLVSFATHEHTGRTASFLYLPGGEVTPEAVLKHVMDGYVAAIGTDQHAYTVLRAAERPGDIAFINPMSPQHPLYFPYGGSDTLTNALIHLQQGPPRDATIY